MNPIRSLAQRALRWIAGPPPVPRRMRAARNSQRDQWAISDPALGTALETTFGNLGRNTIDWYATLRAPDEEVREIMRRVRARARDLERFNAYAECYLTLLTVNVIGPHGFKHQALVRNNNANPETGSDLNEAINDRIEEAWEDWSYAVSLDGRLSLLDVLDLALRTVARDGEAFIRIHRGANLSHGLALEFVDPDLVDESLWRASAGGENEIRMGIEMDAQGQRVAYWVLTGAYNNGGMSAGFGVGTVRERIPATDMIHLYRQKRANQTRGVTWMLPSMVPLKMLDQYEHAELVASGSAASKMGFFTADGDADVVMPTANNEDGSGPKAISMDATPGTLEQLPPGWKFESWDPQHPSTAFGAFVKQALRKVASGFTVSYNALANDLEGVNYSSMRSGLLIERDVWRRLQTWMICAFLRPVYAEWLNMSRLTGNVALDSRAWNKLTAVKFTPRGWPWVDPLKDITAAVLAIQNGLATRTGTSAEDGGDFEDNIETLSNEKKAAEKAGLPEIIAGGAQAQAAIDAAKAQQDALQNPDTPDPASGTNGNSKGAKARKEHERAVANRIAMLLRESDEEATR